MVDETVKYYQASDLAKELVTTLKDAAGNEAAGEYQEAYSSNSHQAEREAATTKAEEALLTYIARLEQKIVYLEWSDLDKDDPDREGN